MSLFGWKQSKEEEVGEVVVRREPAASDAPFRLEFAPGIMLIEAEIRDRKSLEVFVNTLKAMGALLPNDVETPALGGGVIYRDKRTGKTYVMCAKARAWCALRACVKQRERIGHTTCGRKS